MGGAWIALASRAMAGGGDGGSGTGVLVLRVEDIDRPRVVQGSEERIAEDLRWLGIAWDEGPDVGGPFAPYRQSERSRVYEDALATLATQGLTYPCDCSRSEIARAASAPHAGEEVVYPGTCRDLDPRRVMRRDPSIRLRVGGAGTMTWRDGVFGAFAQDLAREVGDFVLKRGDGVYSYQLAVAVDDARMRITDVMRGADLLSSTPRQMFLMDRLGYAPPRYWHLPMVLSHEGDRLAKRSRGAIVRDLRAKGISPEAVRQRLSEALHLREGPTRAWPREPWRIPAEWAT
jgi:glutamyl-tRNA synthetase